MSADSVQRAKWEDDGWCLLEGFLPADAVEQAQGALPSLFPTAEEFAADRDPDRNRPFRIDSHMVMPRFPFESGALNALVVHDSLIDLAQEFLGLADIRLYQGQLSAKYSGGALEDEQLLHVDYGNHATRPATSNSSSSSTSVTSHPRRPPPGWSRAG
jgi:hypothetical protein